MIPSNINKIIDLLNSEKKGVHISTIVPNKGVNIPHSFIIYNDNNDIIVFDINNNDVYSKSLHNAIVKPLLDAVIENWNGPKIINWAGSKIKYKTLHKNAKDSCVPEDVGGGECSQYVTKITTELLNK